ncbi:hypothetical protein DSO57_1016757 [Entomophthora muscae]|uniref:Uncharacterized protein n=1 Tax=Entomophthora muscae TaxID=34485 RepID=A0ACC2SHF7_9FUNG|nr:hypothetical protein DSO57_1016757 [Entomophthora muscae]
MKAPPTLKPDRLHPIPGLTPPTATQYAGIAYITLDGLVNTMVPATGPWALVGQSASYLIKLAPFLWWALPSSQQSKLAANANRPSPGTRQISPQDGPGPANPLSHRLKLLNYSATRWPTTEDSLNGCQIATKLVPLKTHTYAGDVVCLKEVGEGPTTIPANKPQSLTVSSPEKVLQLASSGDMVNNGVKTKHCHFCSPEPVQLRPAKPVPLRAQNYAEAVAWAGSPTSPANKHQLLLVPSPERGMQLACSGDMVDQSSKIKHCHF